MDGLMHRCGVIFLGASKKFTRRQSDSIGDRTIEGFGACVLNLGWVRHSGDDPFGRLDRIVLVRLDLRQLVENRWWQFALFEIETR